MAKVNILPWKLYPKEFEDIDFEPLLQDMSRYCNTYTNFMYGKQYESNRSSCFFYTPSMDPVAISAASKYFSYSKLRSYNFTESEKLMDIKNRVEKLLDTYYDYCLVHIYRDGNDSIYPHNDKESLNEDIASLSFGAVRTFQMRKLKTSEWQYTYELGHGDLFHMLRGCQRIYEHRIKKDPKITKPRINLTFRKYDT
jgi:hypothetical protein